MTFILIKSLAVIIIICFTISCTDTEIGARRPVIISKANIPEEGQVNTIIKIKATAQANNGCYEDLKINFNEIDSAYVLLKATGLYHTNIGYPQYIVEKDTT